MLSQVEETEKAFSKELPTSQSKLSSQIKTTQMQDVRYLRLHVSKFLGNEAMAGYKMQYSVVNHIIQNNKIQTYNVRPINTTIYELCQNRTNWKKRTLLILE